MTTIPTQDEVVDRLVVIWRTVLRDDSLDAHSDLIDHGGTSLTALRALAYIRDEFGRDVDIADLLEDPVPTIVATLVRHAPRWVDDL